MTKPKSEFWKNYEHPEWQKKRLEILTRDKFQCQLCFETEKQLHIHHAYYISGRKPWEYPSWSLVSLCKECHDEQKLKPGQDVEFSDWETMVGAICRHCSPMLMPVLSDIETAVEYGLAGGRSIGEIVYGFEASTGMHDNIQ